MRKRHAGQEEESAIDMTPMLDIVFIMLIFFIVTATFVKESGLDVTRPDAETAVKQSRVGILIAIGENNEIYINRREVDLAAVRANVERLHAENPQGGAVIQADKKAETGVLVEIMDQVRLAGVGAISIAAEENDRHFVVPLFKFGAFALVTTIALFLTMKVLVTGRDYEIEKELATVGIDFVRVERDEEVNTKDRALKRPSQQKPGRTAAAAQITADAAPQYG